MTDTIIRLPCPTCGAPLDSKEHPGVLINHLATEKARRITEEARTRDVKKGKKL